MRGLMFKPNSIIPITLIYCCLLVSVLLESSLLAQEKVSTFHGLVVDLHTGRPLKNVMVRIQRTPMVRITDATGEFKFSKLPIGRYNLEFLKNGYQTLILASQVILPEETTFIRAELASDVGIDTDVFYIGGIEITAEKELLPDKVETMTLIKSCDIEHIQATSLGDVLDLVPGVEMKNQPSLKEPVTAMIRDPRSNDILTAFGAKIIIDDVPISNNSNLQGPLLSGVYTGTANGVDLREIPADHIETVEVIRGIAPANHGDFVGSVINVKTRSSSKPTHRLKGKNNPDTKELNLGGSMPLGAMNLNYNINWGFSERDIRKDYDNTQRIAAQLNFKSKFLNNKFDMSNQFKYSTLFENVRQNPDDPDELVSTNRGYRLIYANQFDYQIDPIGVIKSNLYANYRRVNSFKQYRKIADNRVVSTRMEAGTMEGIKQYGSYIYRYTTIGDELTLGQQLGWNRNFFIGKYFHYIEIGNEFEYDDNFGRGRNFDLLYPSHPGDRPRTFDAVPGTFQHSIYFNDQVTGRLWKEFTLNLGLRFERYTTGKFDHLNFFDSKNGAFLNPRINLAYYLAKYTQIRLGYGKSSKSPPLSFIYPDPDYLDVADIVPRYRGTDTLLVLDSLITTDIFETSNPNLKGYQEEKFELSLDQQLGDFGFSLTGFYSRRTNEPISEIHPFLYYKYFRPNWPGNEDEAIADTLMDFYYTKINGGWSNFDGAEFTLKSRRIKNLNLDFSFNASYHHVKNGTKALSWGPERSDFIIPIYKSTRYWTQKLVLSYQVNYISKALGIWVSLTAQQVPHYQHQRLGFNDSLAVAIYNGLSDQILQIPSSERWAASYESYRLRKNRLDYMTYQYPNKWIFNIRVSKSLFKGGEISLYVNNFLDDRAFYEDQKYHGSYRARNPEIFYGIEFSIMKD